MDDDQAQLTDFELRKLKVELIELERKMHNHETFLKSIVEIQTTEANENSSTATGFFIKKDDRIFVVTNKHVIGDFIFEQDFKIFDSIKVALRTKVDSIEYLHIPLLDDTNTLLKNIKIHPRNYIDIAIIEISEFVKDTWNNYDIVTFTCNQLILFKQFPNYGISTGSSAIISGYGLGIKREKNYPTSTNQIMEPPIVGDDFLTFPLNTPDNIKQIVNSTVFKTVGNAFKGMSGGPITILVEDFPMLEDMKHAIIGIFSVGETANENDPNRYSSVFSFKGDYIIETLNQFD